MPTERLVAIKKVPKKRLVEHNLLYQIKREDLILMEMKDNPLVIEFEQYFEENGAFFLIFEVGMNGTLFSLLFQWRTLSFSVA